ncbi:MAG: diacylglycerol/lipid kinase family protein [Acidimicrobiia bacterium]
METWLVLVNPMAGRRPLDPDRVADALKGAGVDFDLEVPANGDAMRDSIGVAARERRRLVAVAGGDGTANLAVNQILRTEWTAPPILGILPAGTGSDLLRTFGITNDLDEAARHLLGESTYPIDVGRLDGEWGTRYFVNVAQTGVGAAAAETAQGMGRGWGQVRYPLAFLRRLPRFPAARVTIDLDQRSHDSNGLAVIFANGQFFAGGWNVAPRASLTDGRLDLQVIDCKKTYALRLVPKIIKGLHLTDGAVRRYSSPGFLLATSIPWPIEADGDLVGNTPVAVSVVTGALDLKI